MHKINPDIAHLAKPMASVKRDPENARLHPHENLQGIMGSYHKFGQQKPIVVSKDGIVVAGNGQHEAAENLGWTHLAMVTFPGTAREAKAYGITDNTTGLSSTWDFPQLSTILKDLKEFDWKSLGWSETDLAPLLSGWEKPNVEPLPEDKPDNKRKIELTADQFHVVLKGIEQVRKTEESPGLPEGAALELLVADWLSGQ